MLAPVATLQLAAAPALCWPDGRRVALAPRDALLLTWLAIEGATPRSRLALLLWPLADAAAARNVLRQRLFQLRRQIGLAVVEGQAVLSLAAGIGHDLAAADDVLAGLDPGTGGEIDGWLARQRHDRRARMRQALAELADMAEAARDWDGARLHVREMLALDALSEDAHRRLIRLHYLAGDRAAALRAFDDCEQVLKHELGARPSAETLALLRTLEAARPAALQALPAAVLRPPRLVGREAELQALRCTATTPGHVLLLRGEAGLGKSRLIADLADELGPAMLVVCARPGDAGVPHALLARWLRAWLQRPGAVLAPGEQAVLARVLPELGTPPRADQRDRLALVLQALLTRAPGLQALALDDLQFADAASLSLLLPLAGADGPAWVLAQRPAELPDAAQPVLDRLRASSRCSVIDLAPLDIGAVTALLADVDLPGLAMPEQAHSLWRHTGGNPLFLLETLKLAQASQQAPGAPWPQAGSLLRHVQQRLDRLDPLARKLVRCAAVAGQDFDAALAATVLGLHPLDLADAWTALEAAHVLRDGCFAHDLIAEAALATVPAALAPPLHAEIAQALEARGGVPARVADHWLAAGLPARAVLALLAAGRHALAAWQPQEAARRFEQAASLQEAAGQSAAAFETLLRACSVLSEHGDDPRLRPWLERLAALAVDDGQRAALACSQCFVQAVDGDDVGARRLAAEALDLARCAGRVDAEVELLWSLTVLHWDNREPATAARHAEAALPRLVHMPADSPLVDTDRARFRLLHALGLVHGATGRYAESDARLAEALQAAQAMQARHLAEGVAATLAMNALEQGDLARAQPWAARTLEDDDRDGVAANVRAIGLAAASTVQAVAGALGSALALSERSVASCSQGRLRFEPSAWRRYAGLLHELGRRDLALQGLRALQRRSGLSAADQAATAAALLGLGVGAGTAAHRRAAASIIEQVAAFDDFPLRARLLAAAQPGCEPALILPVLAATAEMARDQGAHGLWLSVQARRVAALRAAGRADEAAEQARLAWTGLAAGRQAMDPWPRVAAELSAALHASAPELAQTLAERTLAWMQQAAASLPPAWQATYLSRAPALQVLPLRPALAVPKAAPTHR